MDAVDVQMSTLHGIRYDLDTMTEAFFDRRPYVDYAAEARRFLLMS